MAFKIILNLKHTLLLFRFFLLLNKNLNVGMESNVALCYSGLHKLWYPGIRDTSTWSKFGARGEHGDVFLFSNLDAL